MSPEECRSLAIKLYLWVTHRVVVVSVECSGETTKIRFGCKVQGRLWWSSIRLSTHEARNCFAPDSFSRLVSRINRIASTRHRINTHISGRLALEVTLQDLLSKDFPGIVVRVKPGDNATVNITWNTKRKQLIQVAIPKSVYPEERFLDLLLHDCRTAIQPLYTQDQRPTPKPALDRILEAEEAF